MVSLETLEHLASKGTWSLAVTIAAVVCWMMYQACLKREQDRWEKTDEERREFLERLAQVK